MAKQTPNPFLFEITLRATNEHVQQALADVMARMRDVTDCADALSSVELVLAEAMNNVVEHAYVGQDLGEIGLMCELTATGVRFTLTDHGIPVPDNVLVPRTCQTLSGDMEALPEGGFGWFLILDLAHEVQLRRIGNTTVLHLSVDTV